MINLLQEDSLPRVGNATEYNLNYFSKKSLKTVIEAANKENVNLWDYGYKVLALESELNSFIKEQANEISTEKIEFPVWVTYKLYENVFRHFKDYEVTYDGNYSIFISTSKDWVKL